MSGIGHRRTPDCFAYLVDPDVYNLEAAMNHLESGWWPTKTRDVAVGDRVVFWRTQKHKPPPDRNRGVIALGEVVGESEVVREEDDGFWVATPPEGSERRVPIRYVRPPKFSLWLDGPADALLRRLTVMHGRGTKLYNVTEMQWDELIAFGGGWPEEAPEVKDTRELIEEHVGKRAGRQGFRVSAEARRAIERYAMDRAIDHYEAAGWQVKDVSTTRPYDLRCVRAGDDELHVEVKGTTGDGSQVLMTRGEVEHARRSAFTVSLFVVASIQVSASPGQSPEPSGGIETVFDPWEIEDGILTALQYSYDPPRRP